MLWNWHKDVRSQLKQSECKVFKVKRPVLLQQFAFFHYGEYCAAWCMGWAFGLCFGTGSEEILWIERL